MHFTYSSKNIPRQIPPQSISELLSSVRNIQKNKRGEYDEMLEVLRTPYDTSIEKESREMAKSLWTSSLKYIFVVGIGGSSLGSKAIAEGLSSHGEYLPIYYLESINTRELKKVKSVIEKIKSSDEFVINIISKAGGTTETIANFSILIDMICHIKDYASRVVVTTTKESDLAKIAKDEKYKTLHLSKNISGRFSIFTNVGLFPLLLAGYPISNILDGAKLVSERLNTPYDESRRFAEDIFACMNNGAHILDFFFFNPELESLGKWARQLYAESLGKSRSLSGRDVRTGITPTVTIGTDDLHSMLQLYYAGPKDRITLLIPPLPSENIIIPPHPFTELIEGLAERNIFDVNSAIYTGVHTAFNDNKLMNAEMHYSALNAEMIGAFMQWNMQVVAALSKALNIFAFDQPNIEDYKKVTRKLLSNNY